MNPMDYRPKWYEEAQPEAASAVSDIQGDEPDDGPLTPAEAYVMVAIWCLSAASAISLIAWVLS